MNIFTKFHKDWTTIVDFLLNAKFLASPINFYSPSIIFKKIIAFQVVVDDAPKHAFGIKHSPYIGALKGDDWVSARTEVISYPSTSSTTTIPASNGPLTSSLVTNGHNNTEVKTSVIGGSNVTSNTRTHSDGHRIRTETFTYTKGPTVRTTTTTTSSGQVIQSSA